MRGRRRAAAGRDRDRAHRVIGVLVSGNGTNLQALIDAGLPIARRRLEPQRRLRARARARRRASRPRRSASTATPTATERDLVMATWLEEHGVELVVLAGYMHLLTQPFLARFPGRDRQRPPVAAAGVPRRARDRRRARRRRRDDRRDRAPRRRGPRHRAGDRAGGGRRSSRARRSRSGSTPSSTGCCPRW